MTTENDAIAAAREAVVDAADALISIHPDGWDELHSALTTLIATVERETRAAIAPHPGQTDGGGRQRKERDDG